MKRVQLVQVVDMRERWINMEKVGTRTTKAGVRPMSTAPESGSRHRFSSLTLKFERVGRHKIPRQFIMKGTEEQEMHSPLQSPQEVVISGTNHASRMRGRWDVSLLEEDSKVLIRSGANRGGWELHEVMNGESNAQDECHR